MSWRFLIDEDTNAGTAQELVDRGFDAVTVEATIGKGKLDPRVAQFARNENRVLITTDRDFLDPELSAGLHVLLVAADNATGHEITEKAAELARMADKPDDLKRITWI